MGLAILLFGCAPMNIEAVASNIVEYGIHNISYELCKPFSLIIDYDYCSLKLCYEIRLYKIREIYDYFDFLLTNSLIILLLSISAFSLSCYGSEDWLKLERYSMGNNTPSFYSLDISLNLNFEKCENWVNFVAFFQSWENGLIKNVLCFLFNVS